MGTVSVGGDSVSGELVTGARSDGSLGGSCNCSLGGSGNEQSGISGVKVGRVESVFQRSARSNCSSVASSEDVLKRSSQLGGGC